MPRSRETHKRKVRKGRADALPEETSPLPSIARSTVTWHWKTITTMVITTGVIQLPLGAVWGLIGKLSLFSATFFFPFIPILAAALLARSVVNQMVRPHPGIRMMDAMAVGCVATVIVSVLEIALGLVGGKLLDVKQVSVTLVYAVLVACNVAAYALTVPVIPWMYRTLLASKPPVKNIPKGRKR